MTDPRPTTPATHGSPSTAGGARALGLENALAPYTDALRAQLPSADEIIARAAERQRSSKRQGITLALCLGLSAVWWADPAYRTQTLATAPGERAAWTLADGSQVRLNTATQVDIAFHLRSRRLTLADGEATFEVAHAPWHNLLPALERPFTVTAGKTVVEDIGTIFNVRRQPGDQVEISVQTGRVRVHTSEASTGSVELTSGQRLHSRAGILGAAAPADVDSLTAWHDGRIVFDDTPLAEVVAELRRHGPLPVTLDSAAAQLRISGQFDLDNRENLIALLPHFAPVRLSYHSDGTIAISRLPERAGER